MAQPRRSGHSAFLGLRISKSKFLPTFAVENRKSGDMTKYPIGIQTFEKIVDDGFMYIDKTALMYRLIQEGRYYFLSRPRRFGKSLLLSTMEAYFQGKRELFDGLAIAHLEKDWMTYPVFHIDLNIGVYDSPEALTERLVYHLEGWEKQYGVQPTAAQSMGTRFQNVIKQACESAGQKVVILVDEYDKPILQAMGDEVLQNQFRVALKSFYGVAKSMDAYIQFAFFTGVTKFSKVSIFSDLNNLKDISFNNTYAELCGITEKEIRDNLDEQVDEMAEANGISKNMCYERLKENYDGYHFSRNSTGVYNPFSLLNALNDQCFDDYWFETGTPTILVETLKRTNYELENLTHEEVSSDLLGSLDTLASNPLPLMYQSGYLTIKSYDAQFDNYLLGFPNGEVERGFTKFLFYHYAPIRPERCASFIKGFVTEIRNGQPESFMKRLATMFADQNYQIVGDAELYFHSVVYVVFKMLGFYVEVERHTSDGRMDMVVQTNDFIYVFEFKVDKSATEALNQIEAKQYAQPFALDSRKLYKIGVNFSSKTKRLVEWGIG